MTDAETPVVFVMGPSAAGKTALALALAERFDAEIVSVDSALVYRGLDIGTAKPSPALRRRVPHHLIDVCDPAEHYSAARFRDDALASIEAVRAGGRLPLLVGGTGLYFRALEQGLSELPAADPALRDRLLRELADRGAAEMHARLAAIDAASAARIHPNDPQRVLRALEVHAITGRPMSSLWAETRPAPFEGRIVKLVIAPADRSVLHARIEQRFAAMVERGLLNEVRALRRRPDLSPAKPALRTVGYREAWRYLDGDISFERMMEEAVAATRQLARRQLTWLRRETDCRWFDSGAGNEVDAIGRMLRNSPVFKGSAYALE